jgi:outer membrane receptor protein involved in Fe transport
VGNLTLLLACILSFVSPAFAQLSTATVTGIVRDSSGSVIPAATLTLRNVDTNVERATQTNEVGNYVFANVPPGPYILETSKTGFGTQRVEQFTLTVNQTANFDVTLSVGTVEQTVNVTAAAEMIQSSTAELGAVVAQKQVVDLPLNGRNFTQLLALTPGVAPVSVSQNSGGFGASTTTGSQFVFPAINGQTNRSNFFMTDGINNQGAFTSTYAVPPIIDAIQEFKVNSHNDQAEFGGALGGIVNVVTKSGTNALHGTAWWYVRNDAFDARNTFQQNVVPFKQNQFGASAGGPVVIPKLYDGKNRTFFFVGYQGWRYRRPANSFFRVPTEANLRGDFSDEPRQLFNPFTTRPNPSGTGFIRDPFPNNQIPANLIDQRMVDFARATLPAPTNVGVADRNAIDPTPLRQNQEEYTARIDQNLTDKDFIWFRYSGLLLDQSQSGGRPQLSTTQERPAINWGVSYVRTFTPSLVMQVQYGRVKTEDNARTRFNVPVPDVGFANTFGGSFISGDPIIPALNVADFFSGGESNNLNPSLSDIHQFKGNVSKTIGNHTLRFGGELNSSNFEAFYESANSSFATQQTSNPANTAQIGSSLASFLLNVPDSAGRRNVHETTRWGGVIGFFFQDQWKVSPRLTLNLGLRYDRTFIPPYGEEGTIGQQGGIETGAMDLNRGVYILQRVPPTCAERGAAPCIPAPDGSLPAHVIVDERGKIYHDTTTNWGPRVGLAYRLTQNTALRASGGIFYDNWAAVTQTAQNFEGGWPDVGQQLANNLNVPVPAQPTPTITGQNPFPAGLFPEPTPFNQVLWYMDPNFKNPYSMQWNFGIQHQFTEATAVTLNYVGSGTKRTNLGGYYNVALTPGPGDPRERAPFPYIGPTFFDRSWGRANYHGFQFLMDKRFSRGLAYQVAYTFSKAIDIGSSGWYGVEGHSVQDPYNFNNDRSISSFDLTHVLSVNLLYDIPIGRGQPFSTGNSVADYILGNWQLNTITTARSGLPYNIVIGGDIANTGNTSNYMRANLVGDPDLDNPTRQAWFNRAAFAVPAQYTFGNLGRNRLRSDGYWNVDFSLFRQFPFWEDRRFELRAEAFNIFNTVVYAAPVNNMTSPTFGQVTSIANNPRSLQLGLKIIF